MPDPGTPSPRETTFRVLQGFQPKTSHREDRLQVMRWPAYTSFGASKQLLTKDFERSSKELVLATKTIGALWAERKVSVALLKGDPSALEYSQTPRLWETIRNAGPSRVAGRARGRRIPRIRPAHDIMSRLKLTQEDVQGYLKDVRRRIVHLSRESFRSEEKLRSLLPTREKLLERCELYSCGCGCFQQELAVGCEACGGRLTRGPSSVVVSADIFRRVIEKGIYLELGVGRLLDDNGFDVEPGKYVQGVSGVEHEIDLLARSRLGAVSLLVEVTRNPVDRHELADLVFRISDIPANGYALVSAGPVDKDCALFAKGHRIALFPSIQDSPEDFVHWLEAIQKEQGIAVRQS